MPKYAIGIDFGTLSARALLIDIKDGRELAVSEFSYPHGVMEDALPSGKKLGLDWALQQPQDYLDALFNTSSEVVKQSGVDANDIIGIGIDFTSCTVMPTKKDGTPLCMMKEYQNEPHAYVKLWKHHAAQYCADDLNRIATERNEPWLKNYGGKISSEWTIPKTMQIVREAPELYDAADRIIEGGDWIVWQMTGQEKRSTCFAGYKALWQADSGYPSNEFFKALDPKMEHVIEEKIAGDILPIGSCAGYLKKEMAEKMSLKENTPVAIGIIDAHASVPACSINSTDKMLAIIGTSTCHMLLSKKAQTVKGMCGIVKDGILPGYYGYEAGQSCVGDHFSWFVDHCVPGSYFEEAAKRGISVHELLCEKASSYEVGQSGLVALDWWNGVRSVLMDFDLSGMIVGMTLDTKPEEIYRALIEATAFGTKNIIDTFEKEGVSIAEFYAAGGIAEKNPFAMQIYSDVCNREIKISGSKQSGALGSAMLGIAAAGSDVSGYRDLDEIAGKLGRIKETSFKPVAKNVERYQKLFDIYKELHDYFGIEKASIMKELKRMRIE